MWPWKKVFISLLSLSLFVLLIIFTILSKTSIETARHVPSLWTDSHKDEGEGYSEQIKEGGIKDKIQRDFSKAERDMIDKVFFRRGLRQSSVKDKLHREISDSSLVSNEEKVENMAKEEKGKVEEKEGVEGKEEKEEIEEIEEDGEREGKGEVEEVEVKDEVQEKAEREEAEEKEEIEDLQTTKTLHQNQTIWNNQTWISKFKSDIKEYIYHKTSLGNKSVKFDIPVYSGYENKMKGRASVDNQGTAPVIRLPINDQDEVKLVEKLVTAEANASFTTYKSLTERDLQIVVSLFCFLSPSLFRFPSPSLLPFPSPSLCCFPSLSLSLPPSLSLPRSFFLPHLLSHTNIGNPVLTLMFP